MNINAMMAQAKKMQAQIEEKQKEIEKKEFTVEKQGVKVVLMGTKKIKSISFDEVLIDPEDKDILEGLAIIAINEAMEQIDEAMEAATPKNQQGMPF